MYKVEPKSENLVPMFGLESNPNRGETSNKYVGDLDLFSITALSIKAEEAVKSGDMAEFRRIERFMRAKGWIR